MHCSAVATPDAVFDAMLRGWRAQQVSRHLQVGTIAQRVRMGPSRGRSSRGMAVGVDRACGRGVHGRCRQRRAGSLHDPQLAGRVEGVPRLRRDARYPWVEICESEFGARPRQLFDDLLLARHLSELEGQPGNRPRTRSELATFFAFRDHQVAERQARHRKGALPAFRDTVLFKLIDAWGLRRGEASMLDAVELDRTRPFPRSDGSDRSASATARARAAAARATASC